MEHFRLYEAMRNCTSQPYKKALRFSVKFYLNAAYRFYEKGPGKMK